MILHARRRITRLVKKGDFIMYKYKIRTKCGVHGLKRQCQQVRETYAYADRGALAAIAGIDSYWARECLLGHTAASGSQLRGKASQYASSYQETLERARLRLSAAGHPSYSGRVGRRVVLSTGQAFAPCQVMCQSCDYTLKAYAGLLVGINPPSVAGGKCVLPKQGGSWNETPRHLQCNGGTSVQWTPDGTRCARGKVYYAPKQVRP